MNSSKNNLKKKFRNQLTNSLSWNIVRFALRIWSQIAFRSSSGMIKTSGMSPALTRYFLMRLTVRQASAKDHSSGEITKVIPDYPRVKVAYFSNNLSPDVMKDAIVLAAQPDTKPVVFVKKGQTFGNADVMKARGIEVRTFVDGWDAARIAKSSQADVTILRRGNVFDLALIAANSSGPFIYKPYDFVLRYREQDLNALFSSSPEDEAEKYLLSKANSLYHFHDESAVDVVRSEFGYTGISERINPGCMDETLPKTELPKLSESSDEIHAVYAAGLPRIDSDLRLVGKSDNYNDFVRILEQGIHLHVYVPFTNEDDMKRGLKHYFSLKEQYPNFHPEQALPYAELMVQLTQYDIAYCYAPQRDSIRLKEFQGNLSNNFFTYVDAGLPIFCHQDSWGLSEYVESKGGGIVVSDNEMDSLSQLLSKERVVEMTQAVKSTREQMMFDSDKLIGLVRKTTSRI